MDTGQGHPSLRRRGVDQHRMHHVVVCPTLAKLCPCRTRQHTCACVHVCAVVRSGPVDCVLHPV
jgi:hypothetical protein